MSDGIRACSRCGEPLNEEAFALTLENKLPESVPQVLQLCPRCTESFERWYTKRGKSSSSSGAPNIQGGAMPGASVSKTSRRRHRHRKKMHPVLRNLMIASVSILLFLAAFYWTWTILKRATRADD
jgi:hypothetical protein